MKQNIKVLLTVVVFIVFGFVVAKAADTANITASVTFQQISLTATDGGVSYGTLAASAEKDTTQLTDSQTVTNTGNVNEDFDIKGLATTTGGTCTHWTIKTSGAPGANEYAHSWSINAGTAWDRFTDTYEEFATDKAPLGTTTLDLKIGVPSSSDCTAAQAVDVTVQASAH